MALHVVRNILISAVPFISAFALSLIISIRNPLLPLAFLVIFDMVLCVMSSVIFLTYWRKSKLYSKLLEKVITDTEVPRGDHRVAVLIPVYNEPPSLVVQTALAASIALEDSEDVYVLDDSTDRSVISELDRYSREYGFKLFRRKNRRGYKAGALNDWLREFGSHYDFLMILDSDQRPLPGILRYALRFFDDPEVAFVQVPQYYSSLDTMVALSAHIQQIPFLRVVMRGRHLNGSSFSLGSGTIFKVRSLLGMGFYEESITEDVHTSLSLHERGLKSVYIDLPLVWHGEAPQDMLSYWTQQNRWALGSFQLLGRLLKSRISLIKFLDYLVGLFYWLHIGPLTLVNIMAPVIFLSTGIPFIMVHPLSYLSIYVPILLLSLIIFLVSTRPYRYGIREFLLHQGIQLVASLPVTLAFFQWLGKRKAAFRVTPKGRVRRSFTPYHLYFLVILSLLLASIIIGSVSLSHLRSALFYAYLVNLCWACWWFSIVSFALYVSLARRSPPEVREKVRQTYEGLEGLVISMISCAMALESSLAGYYGMLSKTFPEYSKELEKISEDSSRHYRILRETLSVLGIRDVQERDCLWIKRYLDKVDRLERECGEMMSEECLLVQEEFIMYVFTQLVIESCRSLSLGVRGIESISEDELRHESTLRDILRTLGPSEGTLSR